MAEEVGRSPQQADSGPLHVLPDMGGYLVETGVGLGEGLPFGSYVPVVEAEKLQAELLHELEGSVRRHQGPLHGVGLPVPGTDGGLVAEHVLPPGADGVPPRHGETEMFLHGLSRHDLVGLVFPEGQGIAGKGSFIPDFSNAGEIFSHC